MLSIANAIGGKAGLWSDPREAIAASYFIRVRAKRIVLSPVLLVGLHEHGPHEAGSFQHGKRRDRASQHKWPGINGQELRGLEVPVPSIALQGSFEACCRDIAGLSAQQTLASGKAQATFDALLDQVFRMG